MKLFIDDTWVEDTQASISIKDIAVLRGFAIFDFLRTYEGVPFRLEDHIDRFYNSARLMGMTPKYSKEDMTRIILEGIKMNGFANTYIKFIQTGGLSPDGFMPARDQTFFVYFAKGEEMPQSLYETGIKVCTSSLMRQLPDIKSTNYAASIVEIQKVQQTGAVDILHTDSEGNIYEATRSNFFGVKNGKLVTAETGILKGITRKVILEIAENENIPVELRFINKSELADLDEAFITNSSHEITPVVMIDETRIGDGKPGEMVVNLLYLFKQIV
ncbi:aminotransferase class IV family protein [Candidatus Roizmanbacteria bacterium]|nr:MAG: aminotransferase class IV family protein [Candidatus Roizmanbacteria bacterium]